jgi:hypothetical protein
MTDDHDSKFLLNYNDILLSFDIYFLRNIFTFCRNSIFIKSQIKNHTSLDNKQYNHHLLNLWAIISFISIFGIIFNSG